MKNDLYCYHIYIAVLLTAFILAGCPAKESGIARDNLVRAEAMIEAAEITRGDVIAPREMSAARIELEQASKYLSVEPRSGRLSNNIHYENQLKEISLANSTRAQENARLALLAAGDQTAGDVSVIKTSRNETVNNQQTLNKCEEKLESSASELKECQERIDLARNSNVAGSPARVSDSSIYEELHRALQKKIGADLKEMNASIQTGSLSVRFGEYQTLFKRDSAEITTATMEDLQKFFSSFAEIIMSQEFKDKIKEIRVEGHASSYYLNAESDAERYYQNLLLSQKRAANAIGFLMNNAPLRQNQWLQSHLYAVGMSSNSPVLNDNGTENYDKSRRIEFRVITSD